MSSPAIPHSKSAPNITSPHSTSNIPISSKSVVTSRSAGLPLTSWPKILGYYINRKAKNSDLTEESLQQFNRRNALSEARNSTSSPYYKGLTDFSLDINREKLSGSSPGRESRATSFVTSSSRSSFVVKVQEWGSSCFISKNNEKSSYSSVSSRTKRSHDNRFTTSSSSSSSRVTETVASTETRKKTTKNDSESEKKTRTKTTINDSGSQKKKLTVQFKKSEDTLTSPTMEKPLRERNSELLSMVPLPPPTASPPKSLPYPLPQITPPTAQAMPSPPPTPLSNAPSTPPPQVLYPSPPPAVEAPPQQVSYPSPPPAVEAPPLQVLYPSPPPAVEAPPPQVSYPSPPPAVQAPPPQTPAAGGVTHENKETSTTKNEIIYVWADRYRPSRLQDFLCNKEKALWLQNIVRSWLDTAEECGHFIFEGNPGVGKRTMIWALLREAFGQDKVQAREECKEFYLKGEAVGSILVNLMVSPQHVEVNLSELKGYEKHVIVELIKEKSQMLSDTTLRCNQENCKAIILHEAEKLSTDALSYIKWMLEKFKGCNKVFFCCSDAKKLQPIMPLCRYVQLNEPSIEEILDVLKFIAKKEGIELPHQLACKIANNSKNNLRQAIRSFEATWHFSGCSASLTEDEDIKTGWEDKLANIARNVLEEQSPKQLYIIRGELQNLIEHNVAPECIFQALKEELKKILPEQLQPQFDHLYDEYQKNHTGKKYFPPAHQQEEPGRRQNDQRKNVQQFMRIEEFIARFMSWYKGLVIRSQEA